jgi:hypothetical protein
LAFRRCSKGCKRAAEAEVVAVREWEKPPEDKLFFVRSVLHLGGAAKGCKRSGEVQGVNIFKNYSDEDRTSKSKIT